MGPSSIAVERESSPLDSAAKARTAGSVSSSPVDVSGAEAAQSQDRVGLLLAPLDGIQPRLEPVDEPAGERRRRRQHSHPGQGTDGVDPYGEFLVVHERNDGLDELRCGLAQVDDHAVHQRTEDRGAPGILVTTGEPTVEGLRLAGVQRWLSRADPGGRGAVDRPAEERQDLRQQRLPDTPCGAAPARAATPPPPAPPPV